MLICSSLGSPPWQESFWSSQRFRSRAVTALVLVWAEFANVPVHARTHTSCCNHDQNYLFITHVYTRHTHRYFCFSGSPHLHRFGLRKETGAPRGYWTLGEHANSSYSYTQSIWIISWPSPQRRYDSLYTRNRCKNYVTRLSDVMSEIDLCQSSEAFYLTWIAQSNNKQTRKHI